MKLLFSFLLLLLTALLQAQSPASIIGRNAAEKLVQRVFGRTVEESITVLTAEEARRLLNEYPYAGSVNQAERDRYIYTQNNFYKVNPYLPGSLPKGNQPHGLFPLTAADYHYIFSHSHEEAQLYLKNKAAERNKAAVTPAAENPKRVSPQPSTSQPIKIRIGIIQWALQTLGFKINRDGKLGPETKAALERAFGINCTGLTDEQILAKVDALHKPTGKAAPREYNLTIREKETGTLMEEGPFTETRLNEKLEQLACKWDELCLGLSKLSGSVSFSCTGPNGVQLDITLSSKAAVHIGFDGPDGSRSKLELNADGKLKFSHTKDGMTRAVSNKD